MEITDYDNDFNTIKITIPTNFLSISAKDVPCLVNPPEHDWYEIGIYMKCSKCGMSYEKPASKDFYLNSINKE